ncbi:MAG: DEAD/DEAH box helicase [Peptococcaceae bacterium]|nr:DEAD/DEAH box helicase [Peptococcaceae bacterium]
MENTKLNNTLENVDFSTLGISEDILRALDDMDFEEATKIQAGSIPLMLEGKDIIGYSQTGTGKTAAFGIPAIEAIDRKTRSKNPQVLVLCPTRELAMQACEEMNRFAKYRRGIRIVAIYGGQAIERQFRLLDYGAHIVIGTPGRVMDHMRRNTLKLHELKMVVLDEADEMLNMGFREDVETILESVPKERQTALFSATMPPAIVAITHHYQKNPEMIKVVRQQLTVPSIEQYYYEVPFGGKADAMCRLLESHTPKRSMIFCNTKRQVDELVSELQMRGYLVAGLHGDMRQTARTQVMNSFKRGIVAILVATDVAARGIDVDDVEAVFNYDIPTDVEYYVHRIGRTGRAGKNGRAFTLTVGRKQMYELRNIQNFTKARIQRKSLPSGRDIEANRERRLFEDIRSELTSPTLLEDARMVDQLIQDGFTSVEVACALMNMVSASRRQARKPLKYEVSYDQQGSFQGGGSEQGAKNARKIPSGSDASGPNMWMGPKRREDMVRLALNVGSSHKVSASHIVGAIAGETGLSGKSIGKISVTEKRSFVDVPRQHVSLVLTSMKDCKIRGVRTRICEADSRLQLAFDG